NTSYDVVDGSPALNEVQRTKQMVEHIQQKILKISEAIKLEQSTRDENVSEYLKLASNADKQQAARIKSVFEKKNQKSNATITQLKKKFDSYQRRLREVESSGVGGRQSKSALRDVGANLRDFSGGLVDGVKGGLSGLQQNAAGAIAFKPKDFASRLKSKFGSADNLSSLKFDEQEGDFLTCNYSFIIADIRYGSADDVSSTSGSIDIGMAISNEDQAAHNSILSGPDSPISGGLNRRSDSQYVQSLVALKAEIQVVIYAEGKIKQIVPTVPCRYERLEGQVNDLTELHQREISNLKQELFSMEEKMEYQARERARDMQEAIESCQTRLSKMELQQQQQLVSVDGLENATARALLGKLINLLLSVMAVLLVLVSTVSGLLKPLTRSPIRIASTIVAVGAIIITYKNWVPIL
uniref:Uncharacterized protein n=1 Tax=Ciona savignyi TaxID=51511 RepID=H2YFK0_CIOSA